MTTTDPTVYQPPLTSDKPAAVLDFNKRPIIDLSVLCAPIPKIPLAQCFTLPGDFEICPMSGKLNISTLEAAKMCIDAANSALAPLGPFFRVLDVVLSIIKCLQTVPDILGPPPNPTKLIEALQELGSKLKLLVRLVPALSVPIMMLQLIDMIIMGLDGLSSELTALAQNALLIQRAQINSAQAPGLLTLITCAQQSQAQQLENLQHVFASFNAVIEILNLFAKIAQLQKPFPLPAFGILPPEPLVAAAALKEVVLKMSEYRSLIPI